MNSIKYFVLFSIVSFMLSIGVNTVLSYFGLSMPTIGGFVMRFMFNRTLTSLHKKLKSM